MSFVPLFSSTGGSPIPAKIITSSTVLSLVLVIAATPAGALSPSDGQTSIQLVTTDGLLATFRTHVPPGEYTELYGCGFLTLSPILEGGNASGLTRFTGGCPVYWTGSANSSGTTLTVTVALPYPGSYPMFLLTSWVATWINVTFSPGPPPTAPRALSGNWSTDARNLEYAAEFDVNPRIDHLAWMGNRLSEQVISYRITASVQAGPFVQRGFAMDPWTTFDIFRQGLGDRRTNAMDDVVYHVTAVNTHGESDPTAVCVTVVDIVPQANADCNTTSRGKPIVGFGESGLIALGTTEHATARGWCAVPGECAGVAISPLGGASACTEASDCEGSVAVGLFSAYSCSGKGRSCQVSSAIALGGYASSCSHRADSGYCGVSVAAGALDDAESCSANSQTSCFTSIAIAGTRNASSCSGNRGDGSCYLALAEAILGTRRACMNNAAEFGCTLSGP